MRRRFRASNYQSTTRVKPFICTMPMRLDEGWNQIQFNLSDFTRRAYGTNYIETLRYVSNSRALFIEHFSNSVTIINLHRFIGFKSTPTAVFVESISLTDFTPRMNCHLNSSSSCQSLESLREDKCEQSRRQLTKAGWAESKNKVTTMR